MFQFRLKLLVVVINIAINRTDFNLFGSDIFPILRKQITFVVVMLIVVVQIYLLKFNEYAHV